MENTQKLGTQLKELRLSNSFTLRDVEEVTKISNAYLSQLENNKIMKPSANVLYKLANLYQVDFNLLLELSGIIDRTEREEGPKSLAGFALYSENVTSEEEEELAAYLQYIRSRRKGKGGE
ncbi:MAG: helix-turn-helix transcriptional regulator [Flavobacteriales bacterium]|nr:helix-turn-helix transcriptional regulator [Flavobacteriales bacterium]